MRGAGVRVLKEIAHFPFSLYDSNVLQNVDCLAARRLKEKSQKKIKVAYKKDLLIYEKFKSYGMGIKRI